MTTVTDRRRGAAALAEAATLQELAAQHCVACFDTGQRTTHSGMRLNACVLCTPEDRRDRNRARQLVIELGQRPVEPCTCGQSIHCSWCPASVLPQLPSTSRMAPRYTAPMVKLTHPWFQQYWNMAQQAAQRPNQRVLYSTETPGNPEVVQGQFRRMLLMLNAPFAVNESGGITLDNGSVIGCAAPFPFATHLPC